MTMAKKRVNKSQRKKKKNRQARSTKKIAFRSVFYFFFFSGYDTVARHITDPKKN